MKYTCIKRIAIIFNLKKKGLKDDSCEEYDEIETIDALSKELKAFVPYVFCIEQSKNLVNDILKVNPDFVFNLAEGCGAARARESQVPCILESLGIPYSGSDPIALGLSLDKYLTNIILKSAGIPVPCAFTARDSSQLPYLKGIFKNNKLFIVKPRWEGSSRGIFLNSVVADYGELKERASFIFKKYKQPVLIEEFLENDEITVGVCGNCMPFILGMMRVVPRFKSDEPFLYSQENKRDWQVKIKYEPQGSIKKSIQKAIEKYAREAFRVLELRDIARIDFRLDCKNNPKIIDINPLPGLSPYYSDLPIICKLKRKNYSYLIKTILQEALKRNGFKLIPQKITDE
ncbi:MAG: ATP-grasp domain-containing protein [Candidatus Omnitrophica bacterium]|nr:ATP-grasp domain-containing protein [Candidatus Omnitrophota bacterium]